jgi:hypothetical protein
VSDSKPHKHSGGVLTAVVHVDTDASSTGTLQDPLGKWLQEASMWSEPVGVTNIGHAATASC